LRSFINAEHVSVNVKISVFPSGLSSVQLGKSVHGKRVKLTLPLSQCTLCEWFAKSLVTFLRAFP